MASTAYHEAELAIAANPNDPLYCMPTLPASYERVLDVGCGHGQTLAALGVPHHKGFGIDLAVPESPYTLVVGCGESLPFSDSHFDFVICRVSLPYMDIPKALAEMRRVLKPGGTLWLSLHGWASWRRRIFKAILKLDIRDLIYFGYYVFYNSIWFSLFGTVSYWAHIDNSIESVQTSKSITKALRKVGFHHIEVKRTKFFTVTAQRP